MSYSPKDCKNQPLRKGDKVLARCSYSSDGNFGNIDVNLFETLTVSNIDVASDIFPIELKDSIKQITWFHPSEVLKIPRRYLGKKNEAKLRAFAKLAGFWEGVGDDTEDV